jgi:hypothetical protein
LGNFVFVDLMMLLLRQILDVDINDFSYDTISFATFQSCMINAFPNCHKRKFGSIVFGLQYRDTIVPILLLVSMQSTPAATLSYSLTTE